jgi:hypothetical protein
MKVSRNGFLAGRLMVSIGYGIWLAIEMPMFLAER